MLIVVASMASFGYIRTGALWRDIPERYVSTAEFGVGFTHILHLTFNTEEVEPAKPCELSLGIKISALTQLSNGISFESVRKM